MRTRDFVLLAYRAFDDLMGGKTLLQKRVYFLGVKLHCERDLGYIPHYYGPFSSEVADANTQLKSLGFLEETVVGGGVAGSGGFEIARHDYKLTDAGGRIAELRAEEHAEEWRRILKAAASIKQAGELNYMELSIASKAYLLLEREGRSTLSGIRQRARRFGWKVTDGELENAANFLEKIGLISKG